MIFNDTKYLEVRDIWKNIFYFTYNCIIIITSLSSFLDFTSLDVIVSYKNYLIDYNLY